MTRPERLLQFGRAAVLVLAVLVAYAPAVQGDFLWDDDDYVSANPTLRDAAGLRRIWLEPGATPQYYPLVFTSFWIEYHLWGSAPAGFHVVNILLHALNALLVWRLLARLRLPAAWFAAALFALHPVHVESVAWITERKNTLSACFALAAALCYVRWRDGWPGRNPAGAKHGDSQPVEKRGQTPSRTHSSRAGRQSPGVSPLFSTGPYFLAILLFVAGLLSKTVVVSLPVVLLILAWWRRGRVATWDVIATVPLFVLGLAGGLATWWIESQHVGAKFVDLGLSFAERVLIAGRAVVFYAGKLLWPVDLTFIYPRWQVDAGVWWQWLYPAGVAGALALAWALRVRIGRGLAVAILCFIAVLFPALGFIDFYPMRFSYVADHFQYLASISLLALAAESGRRACARFASLPALQFAAAAALLATLGVLTWQQSQIYTDRLTLWEETNRRNPRSQLVHTHLGIHRLLEGRLRDAAQHLRTALELDPEFESAHLSLGITLAELGQTDAAVRHFERTIELDPRSVEAHRQLARLYNRQSQPDLARQHYEQALAIDADDATTLVDLAILLTDQGDYPEALAQYERARRVAPANPLVHYQRGVLFEILERPRDAADSYREALRFDPAYAYAHYNLGNILVRGGDLPQAIRHYRLALLSRPDFREAAQNLQAALNDLRQRRSQPSP